MGLLGDLEQRFLQPILDRIKAALGPFGKLFDLLTHLWTKLNDAFQKGTSLSIGIRDEISAWRNFKEAVPVRTGVINLPKAIDKSQELIDQVRAAWNSIVDLAKQLREQVQGEAGKNPAEEAEQAMSDIESSGIKNFLQRFPKLAKGLEKVLGFLAILVGALESIIAAIDDLTQILATVKGLREEIETGSTIFLQQKNARKTVKLDDGSSMKIRVGNLH